MKKTFAAIAAAVMAFGAAMTFTACSKDEVAEHDHVWNDGEVTKEATCTAEGIKTFTCTVDGCGQTMTKPVAMIAHSWDEGKVTKDPTCSAEGVKTFTCTAEGCSKTKEEPVDKTAHRYDGGKLTEVPDFLKDGKKAVTCLDCDTEATQPVKAHADFSEQFYTSIADQNNWSYGYANSYNAETGAVDFVRIEQVENDAWKCGNTEIGKGYVKTEGIAVISYTFNYAIPQSVQAGIEIAYTGDEGAASLKAYIIYTDKNDVPNDVVELNADNESSWTFKTEQALNISRGDIFYLVLENDSDAKAGGSLTFTFAAPCVHVWDEGKVAEEPTCEEYGSIEYACINCDKGYTSLLEMIDHKYDEGKVTKEPTEDEYGERTYTCEVCGDTKTERIAPTKFDGANFYDDFSTDGDNGWLYGYATNYNFNTNEFKFNSLNKVNDESWGGVPGLEIKKDWILVEGDAAVGFKVPAGQTKLNVGVDFAGTKAAETRINARVVVMGADGNAKAVEIVNDGQNSASWNVSYEFDVVENDIIYVVLFRHSDAWAQGKLQVVISKDEIVTPPPGPQPTEEEVANFYDDFSTDGDNDWLYGYATDYNWDTNKFTFNSLSKVSDESWGGTPGLEIKKDWILVEGDATVGYKVPAGQTKLKVAVDFAGTSAEETRISARVVVIGTDGNAKAVEIIDDGENTASWNVNYEFDVVEDDIIYVVLFRKSDAWAQGKLQVVISKDEIVTPPPGPQPTDEEVANFKEDFSLDNNPNGAWSYGKMNNPWDNDTREFAPSATTENGAWTAGGVEIKEGWISASDTAAIAYTAEKAGSAKIKVVFQGSGTDTLLGIRLYKVAEGKVVEIEGSYNHSKNEEGKQVLEINYTFAAGETVYVMFSNEKWADSSDAAVPNGTLDIIVTAEEQQTPTPDPTPVFGGASLKEDFSVESNPNGAWSYGYVNYHFKDNEDPDDKEDFEFVAATTKGEFGWSALVEEDEDTKVNVDIRSDFLIANKGFAAIAYKFSAAAKVNVSFKFTGNGPEDNFDDQGKFNIRIGIKHADGTIVGAPSFRDGEVVTVNEVMEFEEGDTIYFIIEHAPKGWDSGRPEITITQADTDADAE